MTINQSAPIVSPRHTSRLIVSLVINGHDTDAASVSKVLGSSFYTLKESMPFLSHFTGDCGMLEHTKIYALRKQLHNIHAGA